jgi:putative ABC transport system ATP-binding protein
MTAPILRTQDLTKTVQSGDDPLTILDGVSFDVDPGATVAIVGASGSGKTTLLGLLAGLDLPTSGEVWLDGSALSGVSEDDRAALRQQLLGFVFQSFQLLPALTALENVMLPLELAGTSDPQATARIWLDRVGLAKRVHHYPRQLSGGEQQRVAVARALAGGPGVLLGDEPTGALDLETGRSVLALLHELSHELHQTVLLVTHNSSIGRMADRVLRMRDGLIVGDERNELPSSALELDW